VTGRQQRQRKQSRWLQETMDPNAVLGGKALVQRRIGGEGGAQGAWMSLAGWGFVLSVAGGEAVGVWRGSSRAAELQSWVLLGGPAGQIAAGFWLAVVLRCQPCNPAPSHNLLAHVPACT
jgi:hypothetical protein